MKRFLQFAAACVVILLAWTLGHAQSVIYVSDGSSGQVLSVNTATGVSTQVFYQVGAAPEDGTVGPDGRVYVCDPTNGRIYVITPNGKSSTFTTIYNSATRTGNFATAPQGPRFTPTGDLIFSDKVTGALWMLSKASSFSSLSPLFSPPTAVTGAGSAFTLPGDLLLVSGRNILQLSPPFVSATTAFTLPMQPFGIARDSSNRVFVAENTLGADGDVRVCTFTSAGAPNGCSVLTNFTVAGVKQFPFYLEISTDDVLWVGTTDAALTNGKLWRIDLTQAVASPVVVATLPKFKGTPPPAIGVAIPPTSKTLDKTVSVGTTKPFNFGPDVFELGVLSCTAGSTLQARITAQQKRPQDVEAMIAGVNYNGRIVNPTVIPELSQEGFARTFTVNPLGCGATDFFETNIAAYTAAPSSVNPGMVRCDTAGSKTTCVVLPMFAYWISTGPLPGDAVVSGRTKGFSEFVFVNLPFAKPNLTFGGVLTPFTPSSTSPGSPVIFNSGQNITFKFQVFDASGNPASNVQAVLSVERIDPNPNRVNVNPSGNANQPPVFRFSASGSQYVYNLSTGDATVWTQGEYRANITADGFNPQSVYFCLDVCH